MKRNRVRTSATMATVASHTMSGRLDDAFVEMIVNNLLGLSEKDWLDEIAKSLAASVLSNRRA